MHHMFAYALWVISFKDLFFYFKRISFWSKCVSVYYMQAWYLQRTEEGTEYPWNWSYKQL